MSIIRNPENIVSFTDTTDVVNQFGALEHLTSTFAHRSWCTIWCWFVGWSHNHSGTCKFIAMDHRLFKVRTHNSRENSEKQYFAYFAPFYCGLVRLKWSGRKLSIQIELECVCVGVYGVSHIDNLLSVWFMRKWHTSRISNVQCSLSSLPHTINV